MPESQSLAIVWWPIDRPRPYPRNPRVITETAVAKVAASIQEFGWRQPIVVDENDEILIGHTRLKAAYKLGHKLVPVHIALGLTEAQKRALRLADNRSHEEARWDIEILDVELREIAVTGFDLTLTGFDPVELPSQSPAFSPIPQTEVRPLDRMIEVTCPQCGYTFERRPR